MNLFLQIFVWFSCAVSLGCMIFTVCNVIKQQKIENNIYLILKNWNKDGR